MQTAHVFFSKVKGVRVAIGAAMLVGVSAAQAALPAPVTAAFAAMETGIDDVEAGIWPVIAAALVAFTIIKLVKRGAAKV